MENRQDTVKSHLYNALHGYYDCVVEENLLENRLEADEEQVQHFFGINRNEMKSTEDLFWHMCNHLVHPDDLVKMDLFRSVDLWKRFEQGERGVSVEFRMKDRQGQYEWVSLTVLFDVSEADHSISYFISLFRNVNEEKKEHLHNELLARRDGMTGLYNRDYTEFLVSKMMQKRLSGLGYAMLVLDIDDFKSVNDSYGHLTGDMVIKEVAKRLSLSFDKAIIGRIGGDEFMVFFEYDQPREDVAGMCEEKRKELSFQYHENALVLHIHCSMGMYFNPEGNVSYEKAFDFADKALYEAKSKGKNILCVSNAN